MWDDIIKAMTSATVRFELLSTVHSSPVSPHLCKLTVLCVFIILCWVVFDEANVLSQVTLDVQREGGVSTKGPRGGVFVMYNCARLHTLFDSYERGVEKGEIWGRLHFCLMLEQKQTFEKEKKKKTYRISSHYFCRLDFEVTLDYLCVYLTNCSIYIFFSEWINRKDRFSEWSISFQLRECVHVQTVVSLLFGRFALSNVVFSLHLYLLHYSSNNLLKHSSVNSKQNKYMNNSKAAFLTSCKQLF